MKLSYMLKASEAIACNAMPAPLRVDSVDIEWVGEGQELTGANLVMRSLPMRLDPNSGAVVVRNRARDIVAFRVATFVADSIYALSGQELDPRQVFTTAPVAEAETPQEARLLSQVKKENAVGLAVTFAVSRPLNSARLSGSQSRALAIAHYARGLRAADPFDKVDAFYKVVETVAPKGLEREPLDAWVSNHARSIDPVFTEARAKQLRQLRNRVTHPQADLGHLSPHELRHIERVQANLDDLERLARILIWGTATPWA